MGNQTALLRLALRITVPALLLSAAAFTLLAPAPAARADEEYESLHHSHFRGGDAWADIASNGVVTLTARTRWRKDFFDGINPSRFGLATFFCPFDGRNYTFTPATGMRVVRVSDGATVFSWGNAAFSMPGTTISTDEISNPAHSERIQQLIIPLGSTSATGQINTPRNLPYGTYDIVWNDYARIRGIQNIEPSMSCGTDASGFGLRVRVVHNGTPANGPSLQSTFGQIVARGFEYSQNLNVTDPNGDSLAYRLSPLSPYSPNFGPITQVPGISLDQSGQIRIPASSTSGLLNNYWNEPAGDYLVKVEIEDSKGFISQRDGLLDAITSTNNPPTIDPIGDRTIQAGQTITFTVRATDPDALQTLTLKATGLPAGAMFPVVAGTSPVTGAFSWTPSAGQLGDFSINFDATDSGTAALSYQDKLSASRHVIMSVQSANRPPVLEEIANLRVGVDPLNTQAFVAETKTYDARASDPNHDPVSYSLPVLINPAGSSVPLSALGASVANAVDHLGRQIGRISIAPGSEDVGVWQLRVRVDDGYGASDEENLFVSVGTFTNQSPIFTSQNFESLVIEGATVAFSVAVSDPDPGQMATLAVVGQPAGSSFAGGVGNPVSSTFSWTPTAGQAGDYTVRFEVRDNGTPPITESFETVIHVLRSGPGPTRIVRVTPTEGLPAGGTPVVLDGEGFTGTIGVAVGGNPVPNLVALNSNLLTFNTPPGTEGATADIVVTSAGGTATLAYGFLYVTRDNTPPVIAVPPDITAEATGPAGAIVAYVASAVDAVDGNVPVACAPVSGAAFPIGVATVACSASDTRRNTANASFTVTVQDTTPPVLTAPANITAEATGAAGAAVSFAATATDIVDGSVAVTCSPASGSTFAIGSSAVSCSATDGHGNSGTANFTVTVQDTTSPMVTVPAGITAEATSAAGAALNFSASATDIVDGAVAAACSPASGSTYPLGTTAVACSATDAHGNTGSASFFVTVQDTTPPVVTVPGNITAEATGAAGTAVSFSSSANDIVDGAVAATCSPASGSTYPLGTTAVGCSATDAHSNTRSASFFVTVQDTTPPSVTVPGNIIAEATGASGVVVTFSASANDIVDGAVATTCNPASGSTFPIGTTIVGCAATDTRGNTGSASFTVTVVDTTPPVVTVLANITAEATGSSGAVVPYTASAADIVDGTVAATCTPASGSTFAIGTTIVGCTATDFHGNSGSASFNVTVVDTTPPVLTVPGNITAEATGAAGAAVTFAASATDIVDGAVPVICSPASGPTFGINTTAVSCTATDAHGNTGSASFQVTVVDTTPPAVTVPANISTEATSAAGANVGFSASATDTVDGTVVATCSPGSGSTFAIGTATVSCSATDAHGNTGSASFQVTVVDTTPPVVTVPGGITAEATGPTGAVVTYTATANDIVDGTVAATCTPASGSTFAIGTTAVSCSATDTHGNTGSASFFVTVQDTTPPAVTVPGNITTEATGPAGASVTYVATASDAVDGNVPVVCTPSSGTTFPIGPTTVTCSASDTRANTATASFTVTVVDTTPPAVTVPANISTEATGPAGAAVTYTATATDIVDGSVAAACTPPSGSTFPLGSTTVTCTATDAHGNTGAASFTVRVVDTTPPETSILSAIDGDGLALSDGGETLSASASFTFVGSDAVGVVAFECSMDGGPFTGCSSPSPYSGLLLGGRTFAVKAIDAALNTDGTPAVFTWTVITSARATENLITTILRLGLPASVANSLTAPLNQTATLLNDGNPKNDVAACGQLNAFLNQVSAKEKSGQLSPAQAAELRRQANLISSYVGC